MSYLSLNQLKTVTDFRKVNAERKSLSNQQTVFLSHSHKDRDIIGKVIGFLLLQGTYVYVDWLDPDMPQTTCGETAAKLKSKIVDCGKFVVLVTENSVESKWIPWELGYADGVKPIENIAIFPLKRYYNTADSYFSGIEYFQLYPIIKEGFIDGKSYFSVFPPDRLGGKGQFIKSWLDIKQGIFNY
jgi:hypothetical protein